MFSIHGERIHLIFIIEYWYNCSIFKLHMFILFCMYMGGQVYHGTQRRAEEMASQDHLCYSYPSGLEGESQGIG